MNTEIQCQCVNWARAHPGPVTNHHPNCAHYNDSLIDVWKVDYDGAGFYTDNEQEAKDAIHSSLGSSSLSILKIKMHREVFEYLHEFEGF